MVSRTPIYFTGRVCRNQDMGKLIHTWFSLLKKTGIIRMEELDMGAADNVTFDLLQNEGFLMQGCFKSSLSILRAAPDAQPGHYYAALFNYSIGFERLLKVLLLLDNWHRERKFPNNNELRQYGGRSGHNLGKLYKSAIRLFPRYGVNWKDTYELDEIDGDFLTFLSDFANGSRYFNLNALTDSSESAESPDPIKRWECLLYRVYAIDVAKEEPPHGAVLVPEPDDLSSEHHITIVLASRQMCWRLVRFLIPLKDLLIAIRAQVQRDDKGDASAPFMEEFLDLVCEDKSIVLEDAEWP